MRSWDFLGRAAPRTSASIHVVHRVAYTNTIKVGREGVTWKVWAVFCLSFQL
jgi:hypothetical protein